MSVPCFSFPKFDISRKKIPRFVEQIFTVEQVLTSFAEFNFLILG